MLFPSHSLRQLGAPSKKPSPTTSSSPLPSGTSIRHALLYKLPPRKSVRSPIPALSTSSATCPNYVSVLPSRKRSLEAKECLSRLSSISIRTVPGTQQVHRKCVPEQRKPSHCAPCLPNNIFLNQGSASADRLRRPAPCPSVITRIPAGCAGKHVKPRVLPSTQPPLLTSGGRMQTELAILVRITTKTRDKNAGHIPKQKLLRYEDILVKRVTEGGRHRSWEEDCTLLTKA